MTPDYVVYMTIAGIAKSVGNSALPNAPVIDDSNDRPPYRVRIAALGMRVTHLLGRRESATTHSQSAPAAS